MSGYRTYEVVFLGSMLVAIVATVAVIRLARATRLVDQPGVRKIHASAIPRIGGAAIVFAVLALVLPVLALDNAIGQAFRESQTQIITILAGGLFMFAVGLIDDTIGLRARVKLLAQVLAAVAVCAAGIRIETVAIEGIVTLHFGWLSWPLTIVWIVGITNALNLIDGLDGLAAGISVITCGVIAAFALYVGHPVIAVLMLAVLGSLLGFLFLNFNPARVFMGDCGSLFLGFLISASSVRCAEKSATIVGLALPFAALGVPIFDTLFSILRRTLQRRGIMSPDRGHIHHRLLAMGLKQGQVALLIYVITLTSAGLGLFMLFIPGLGTLAILGLVILMLLIVFRAVGAVRLRETLALLRRNRSIHQQALAEKQAYEAVELQVREAATFEQWWSALCLAAERLEFLRLSLAGSDGEEPGRNREWRRPGATTGPGEIITMSLPVRRQRAQEPLRAQIDVFVNGSLESAGRRVTLFGRLLDEHSIAGLPRQPREATATASHGPAAPPSQYPPVPADIRGSDRGDATQHNPA
jgi:UDP-GlcNAc:undecaprenyl-phosphate GlcNAc-1-phosphate transferase